MKRKFYLCLIVFLSLFVFIFSASAGINEDTTIWRDYNDNCGNIASSETWICASMRSYNNRFHRILLRFDTDSISIGTTINKATLRLYAYSQNDYESNYFNVSRVKEDWNSSATWCKRSDSEPWSTNGGAWAISGQAKVLIPKKDIGSGEWVEWDITNIVKDWIENGKPNFGMIVFQDYLDKIDKPQSIDFYSMDCANENLRPKLVIETPTALIIITPKNTPDNTAIPGDLDNDGDVDNNDYMAFLDAFDTCVGDEDFLSAADFDFDGCITINDYRIMRSL